MRLLKTGSAAASVVVALLLIAVPASAKGFSSAKFTGPGLPPGGVRIHGGDDRPGPADSVLFQSGVFNSEKSPGPWAYGLDRADLGAPYALVVAPDWDPSSHVTVVLYPYAQGGPWAYTPPHQSIGPGTEMVVGGWWQVGHRLIGSFSERMARGFRAFLVRHGFPATAPAYAAPDTPLPGQPVTVHRQPLPATTATGASNGWPAWAWILIAIGMAGALLLVASRQRRRVMA
jgi:hypothetical protein